MAKISRSQQIFSEIDYLLDAGRYEDAKVLVSFLDRYWSDRESQLALLLINVTLYGPLPYKEEIGQLRATGDATGLEKEIIRKIFLQAEKEELGMHQVHANPLNPPAQPEISASSPKKDKSADKSELVQQREAEIVVLRKQLTEAGEAKEQAGRLLEETVRRDTQILRTKEAELDALEDRFALSVCSLENQLHEKEKLLELRDKDIETIRSELDGLAAQLADLSSAKDKEGELLRDQLAEKEKLLGLKEEGAQKIREEGLERVRALEVGLSKQESLLAARQAEIDRLAGEISELNRQRAQAAAETNTAERFLQEHLEEQSRERFRALEELLAQRDAEIDGLRSEIGELNQRRAELDTKSERSESLFVSDPTDGFTLSQAKEVKPTGARLIPGNDSISEEPNWLRRAWEQMAKTFPENGLPIGAAALLIIAIGYFLASDRRTPPNYPDVFLSSPGVDAPATADAPMEPKSAIVENEAGKGRIERASIRRENPAGRMVPYVTRRTVSLRDEPRFGASVKSQIGAGTPISVLEARGDWFKIRTSASGAIGYVRREHLVPPKNFIR